MVLFWSLPAGSSTVLVMDRLEAYRLVECSVAHRAKESARYHCFPALFFSSRKA
jgi:hypothetical protein